MSLSRIKKKIHQTNKTANGSLGIENKRDVITELPPEIKKRYKWVKITQDTQKR
jgi:hypothetical protein